MKKICRRIVPLAALTLLASTLNAQPVLSAHAEVLSESDSSWTGVKLPSYPKGQPQLAVQKVTMPAHSALPWHSHPVPNAVYVASGEVTIEDKASGKKQTYIAGQAFNEVVNAVHRGVTGDKPAVLVITYSGSPGVPILIPEEREKL